MADISRINQKKLISLISSNIFNIAEIPENFELTPIQKNQVNAYKFKKIILDSKAINQKLYKLEYPLYFKTRVSKMWYRKTKIINVF